MTLQSTLVRLTTLARDCEAEIQLTTQLEFTGATLTVHWCGGPDEGLPREVNLYFGPENDESDSFLWAFVIDPILYMWAIDEGVPEEGATNMATRLVESVQAVEDYLMGRPYAHYRPRNRSNSNS